jgi:hypothetical protein
VKLERRGRPLANTAINQNTIIGFLMWIMVIGFIFAILTDTLR